MAQTRFGRYELKYYVSPGEIAQVRQMIRPFMVPDPHSRGRADGRYTVRSIYYDTSALRFYHEKEAGEAIRKKLRVRTYDRYSRQAVAFFEIKRKYGVTIYKERVGMSYDQADRLLQLGPVERLSAKLLRELNLSYAAHSTLTRFFFLEEALQLAPSVLIVYDREAFVGAEHKRTRVTFDHNVRSIYRPLLDEIFTDRGLRHLTNRRQILEIKFDEVMPPWLRPVTALLNRSNRPISKYCNGIDLWEEADQSAAALGVWN